ncbi:UNVERIFIED_CONTAM: thrombospondin type 1 domain-containing protein [Hammondia hammondi]|eukprot:XP_008887032.1 thrombospondin type 1 domain-containing protein [Hammondia hammondi]
MLEKRRRRGFLLPAALLGLLALLSADLEERNEAFSLCAAFAQNASSAHKPWIGNCPRFGFAFHGSFRSSSALLEAPSEAESVSACATRCHNFVVSSFFSSTLCRGFEFDRRTRLCSLFAALPSPLSPLSRPSPFIASGVSPTKTAGSLCATSCLVSAWSEWSACEGEGRPGRGPLDPPGGFQRRSRHIRQLPMWGNERCPALEELRPCSGDPRCAMEGVGVLGWGCSPADDFAESGTDRHFVSSFESCGHLCAADPDCTFFSLDRRPRASLALPSGAGGSGDERQGLGGDRETLGHETAASMLCYIVHGPEPGCMFLSEHFVSAPRLGGTAACPVDCVAGEWGDWSPCSHPCGTSQQSRTRDVKIPARNGGKECQLVETRNCLGSPMYPRVNCAEAECTYSPWSAWSPCNSPCEGGTQERVRSVLTGDSSACKAVKMVRACNDGVACSSRVGCNASSFGAWSPCTASCEGGERHRSRQIDFSFGTGGSACAGVSPLQVETCNEDVACGHDCKFSPWEEWSACKAVPGAGCGQRNGRRQRYRGILKQGRDPFSGRPLPCGDKQAFVEVQDCVVPGADTCADACVMTPWTTWSACSASCGEGWRSRVRSILKPLLSGNGKEGCPPTVETERCSQSELPCPEAPPEESTSGFLGSGSPQCEMGEWQPWTACNGDCQRFRFRLPLAGSSTQSACSVEIQEESCDSGACISASNAEAWAGKNSATSQAALGFVPSEKASSSGVRAAGDSFSPFGTATVLPASEADVSAIARACLLSILLTLLIVFLFIYFRKKGVRGRRYIYPLDGGWSAANSFGDNDETSSFVMTQGRENSQENPNVESGETQAETEEVESNASEKLAKVDVDQDLAFWDDEDEASKEDK